MSEMVYNVFGELVNIQNNKANIIEQFSNDKPVSKNII
jgi:hypothetical protein